MMEALRGLGYSTAAALADIIDNSISAGATDVKIKFDWDGLDSRISLVDNGRGMEDDELERAMRLGDKSPLDVRSAGDLGRFGMGLKTASFSQCRVLTVASKKSANISCLRWDLDALASNPTGGWLLYEGPTPGSERYIEFPDTCVEGTIVLWEKLDRIVTAGYTVDDFITLTFEVERHLAMVFHRLIQGPRPKIRLFINENPVAAWDPFLSGHPATWNSPIDKIQTIDGPVEVECHVLPHRDKLPDEDWKVCAGPNGWTAQQGFYVYRNERLLVAGGWLGLGPNRAWNREEAHRLARIRLDIPNTADAAWKIDIRKSTARPPVSLRPRLTRLAEITRDRARKVFAYRGAPTPSTTGAPLEQAWAMEKTKSGMRYRIDEKHPAVSAVLESSGPLLPLVKAMLKIIQETVPVQRIWLDTAENKEIPRTGFSGEPPEAISGVLRTLYADMVGRRGLSSELAKRALLATEPFQNFPVLVANLSAADTFQ